MEVDSDNCIISELNVASKEIVKRIVDIWEEVIDWHSKFDEDFELDKEGRSNFAFMISKAIHDPSQVVYIAHINEEIVGFLFGYVKTHSGFFRKRTIAHVSDIAIDPSFRGSGVGTALMERFEKEFAKANEAEELSLYVHSQNEKGVNFYKKLGFKVKLLSMRKKVSLREN